MNNLKNIIKAIALFFLMQLMATLIGRIVPLNEICQSLVTITIYLFGSFIVFSKWFKSIKEKSTERIFDKRNTFIIFFISFGYAILSVFFLNTMYSHFPSLIVPIEEYETTTWFLILAIFVAPVVEELLFRGIIFYYLREMKGFWIANIIQALLFGLAHGNVVQGIYTAILGMILGYYYHKNRNILSPIFLHIFFNFFGIFLPHVLFSNSMTIWLMLGIICFGIGILLLSDGLRENYFLLLDRKKINTSIVSVKIADYLQSDTDAVFSVTEETILNQNSISERIIDESGTLKKIKGLNTKIVSGKAKESSGGKLPFAYIIHCVIPKWDKTRDNKLQIFNAYREGLSLAEELGCKKVTIPILKENDIQYPINVYHQMLIKAILRFCSSPTDIKRIELVCADKQTQIRLSKKLH